MAGAINVRASVAPVQCMCTQALSADSSGLATILKQGRPGSSGPSAAVACLPIVFSSITKSSLQHKSTLPSEFSTLKMTVQPTQRKSIAEHQEACGEVITEKHWDEKVPVIDFAGLEGPEREIISQQVAKAAETWGFFQVVNHGMDPALMEAAKAVSKDFFHLPQEEKSKIKVVPGIIQGWNHSTLSGAIGESKLNRPDSVEHLYLAQQPDTQEHLERYALNPPSYRSTILEYTKEIQGLHEKVLAVLSEMLGLSPEALKTHLTDPCGQVTMRTNFYPYREGDEQPKGVCHAHSDPGGLTFLLADDAPGLEVRKDGRWVPVDPIPRGLHCQYR